jgi:hypothetical protein
MLGWGPEDIGFTTVDNEELRDCSTLLRGAHRTPFAAPARHLNVTSKAQGMPQLANVHQGTFGGRPD